MVEALIAIPVFIVIFTSMVYIVRLYGAKQRTLREAREQVWTSAMNCGSVSGNLSEVPGGDDGKAEANKYTGAPGGSTLTVGGGMTSASSSASASESSALASFSHSVTTTSTVMCNVKKEPGSLQGVLNYAWDMFKGNVPWK
jgi:hypothetical protein